MDSIAKAQAVITDRTKQGLVTKETAPFIDYLNTGSSSNFDASEISPYGLLDRYNELFEPPQFHRMFGTEMGKGVLAGIYIHQALLRMWEEDLDNI